MQIDTIKSIQKMSILETALWAFVSGCKMTDQNKTLDLCVIEFISFAGVHDIDKSTLKMSYYRMCGKVMTAKGISKENIPMQEIEVMKEAIDCFQNALNKING